DPRPAPPTRAPQAPAPRRTGTTGVDEQHPAPLALGPAAGERRGVLLVNPGGPGASGIDFLRDAGGIFGPRVRRAFDLVAWDPRGVGASAPVDCGDELDAFYAVDRSPVGLAEVSANVDAARRFTEACERRSGPLLADVSTAATVRDLEAIRVALGGDLLDYFGFSYGTVIGADYVRAHPDRVRTMVLDGAVDPARPYATALTEQAAALDAGLDRFFAWCAREAPCRLGRPSGRAPAAAYDALVARVEAEPIRARVDGEARRLGAGELDIAVAGSLYAGARGFPALGEALADAAGGTPDALLRTFDAYTGRGRDGRYSGQTAGLYAVGCVDAPAPRSVEQVAATAEAAAEAAPRFGPSTVWLGLPCTFWPVPAAAAPGPTTVPVGPRVLVVGTTGDPVTPYAWSRDLTRTLGDARLLTVVGTAHTAYPTGAPCVRRFVDDYLVDLRMPPPAARCPD
ncbi:MAG: alpha/beta hydrolase, partial [Actinomycetota bacterium]